MSDTNSYKDITALLSDKRHVLEKQNLISSIYNCKDNKKNNVNFKSVFRKVDCIRHAFVNSLKIEEGQEIAVFTHHSEDFYALCYAALLSNLVLLLLDTSFDKEELTAALSSTNIKGVFFPSSVAPAIANAIGGIKSIPNWIMYDYDSAPSSPEIKSLKFLIEKNEFSEQIENCKAYDDEEAFIFVDKTYQKFPIGCSFSQAQLIQIAKTHLNLLKKISNGNKRVGIFIKEHSLPSFIYSIIAPLLEEIDCTIFKNYDIEKFWDNVKTQNIEIAILEFEEAKNINKRVKVEQLNFEQEFNILFISDESIAIKEFQTLSSGLQCDIHTSFFRLEAGGLLTHHCHKFNETTKCDETLCLGAALESIELQIVDATGKKVKDGVVGKLEIKTPQIMLGYGSTKPGNDLHVDSTILRTNAEAFIQGIGTSKELLFFKKGQSTKNLIASGVNKNINLDNITALEIDDARKIAQNDPSNNKLNLLTEEQLKTDYGKQCIEEILTLASHVKDAESLLRGTVSTLCLHTFFERALVIEVFDSEMRYQVIANEGFQFVNDSFVNIENMNSVFLNAKGKLNSFSTRRSPNMPFETPNYAFSYLPSQRTGNLIMYLDLPNSEVLPFPERRIFRKTTALLSALLQKFAFRYAS